MTRTIFILITSLVLVSFTGCQRSKYPLGRTKADTKDPVYTFQPDVNQPAPR